MEKVSKNTTAYVVKDKDSNEYYTGGHNWNSSLLKAKFYDNRALAFLILSEYPTKHLVVESVLLIIA